MATIFPLNPTVNDEYNGYVWNGTAWKVIGSNFTGGGASLPTQTDNSGKFLTTDGSNASWGFPPSYQLNSDQQSLQVDTDGSWYYVSLWESADRPSLSVGTYDFSIGATLQAGSFGAATSTGVAGYLASGSGTTGGSSITCGVSSGYSSGGQDLRTILGPDIAQTYTSTDSSYTYYTTSPSSTNVWRELLITGVITVSSAGSHDWRIRFSANPTSITRVAGSWWNYAKIA